MVTIPLNWLRAFEAVARHCSVSNGARELNVTTSAASQNVKRLEEMLNRPLLSREGNRVRLSEAGARLSAMLAPAFAMIDEAVEPFAPRAPGRVTILSPKAFGRAVIAPQLAALNDASPHRARLVGEGVHDRSAIDIEIVRAEAPPVEGAVEIGRDMIFPVCAPDYRPTREEGVVEGATLIGGPWSREMWAKWFELAEAPRFVASQLVSAPNEHACLESARLGLGFALVRSSDAASPLALKTLTAPYPARLEARDRYWAIARSRSTSSQHVFEWLVRRFGVQRSAKRVAAAP